MKEGIKLYRQGSGPAITLIHGWGMNASIFGPLVQRLENDFEVIRVDLPGHGLSPWRSTIEFDGQLDMLADSLPDSNLLGWSMGGLYAINLAKKHPQKFPRLILSNCNPCFVQKPGWPCAVAAAVFNEFSQSLIENWSATIKRFMGLQMHGVEQARDLIRQISALLISGGEPDPDALRQGLELLLRLDARSTLVALPQPVLSILGERDRLAPKCLAQQLALINPQIRVECLAQSAHAPFVSHPVLFSELLREFIKPSQA